MVIVYYSIPPLLTVVQSAFFVRCSNSGLSQTPVVAVLFAEAQTPVVAEFFAEAPTPVVAAVFAATPGVAVDLDLGRN